MELNAAIFATFSIVAITQVFRQLLPNCFAFPWQLGIHEIVPKTFVKYWWFKDEDSLFFFSKDKIIIHTFPFFSQSNLRSVVLLGSLSFCLFLNFNTHEVREGFDVLLSLFFMSAFLVLPLRLSFQEVQKFHLDTVMYISFDLISYIIAFQFVVVNF